MNILTIIIAVVISYFEIHTLIDTIYRTEEEDKLFSQALITGLIFLALGVSFLIVGMMILC